MVRIPMILRGAILSFTLIAMGCEGDRGAFLPAIPGALSGTGSSAGSTYTPRTKTPQVVARYGKGFLEDDSGRLILHLKGMPYEMGVQYGVLAGAKIEELILVLRDYIQQFGLPPFLQPAASIVAAAIYRPYYPADVLDEIRGIRDGMRLVNSGTFVTEDDLVFLSCWIDLGATCDLDFINCSSLAVWGDLTVDGKTFQSRNVDLFIGTGIENCGIAVINKQYGKVPFMNPALAGMLYCSSGLNAHGVGIGQIWANSVDRNFGKPWGLSTRQILSEAKNSDEAAAILVNEPHRTYGSNFVFGDRGDGRGGLPGGRAVEYTWHFCTVFQDNDPLELHALWQGQPYAIRIPYAVFRADTAMDPVIRSYQTCTNGPYGDPRTGGAYRNRYKGQADEIIAYAQAGVKIGHLEVEAISRKVAMPSAALQCCVYANTDLQLWVAQSAIRNGQVSPACNEVYHHYDLDYYMPTVRLALDKQTYSQGERQRVTVATSNLGSNRDLDLCFTVQAASGGAPIPYPGQTQPVRLTLQHMQENSTVIELDLPAGGLAAGAYQVVAELFEHGTRDLVDVDMAAFSLQ